MMNPWLVLSVVLALGVAFYGGELKGAGDEKMRWEAKSFKELAEASATARAQESQWQEVVNGTARNYDKKVAGIRRTLDTALDGLRDRPPRAIGPAGGVSADSRAACAGAGGATGAELSGADAGFLVREAARGDELRAGLDACYAVIDGVRQ